MNGAPWRRGLPGALGIAVLASVARADAPIDQYGLFDSTNLVIVDDWTKLTWQRYASSELFTFDDAATYCSVLSLVQPSGWRVPSYKELLTIVDEAPHPEYENLGVVLKSIDGNAFPGTAVDAPYWTSSVFAGTATVPSAYQVDFHVGEAGYEDTIRKMYVRCVHD